MNADKEEIEVVGHASGSGTISELTAALTSVWTEILQNPKLRLQAAGILGVGEVEVEAQQAPPLYLQPGQQGTGAVDIAIMVVTYIGTDVLLGSLTDLAREEVKRRMKQLWAELLEPAIRGRLPERDALG